jgi:hypothetical protein
MLSTQGIARSAVVKSPHWSILPTGLGVAGFTSSSVRAACEISVVGIGMTVGASGELLHANRHGLLPAAC